MPTTAWRPDGTPINALEETTERWLELYKEIKAGLRLHCEGGSCAEGRERGWEDMRPREESPSVGRRRHFYHHDPRGIMRHPCSNDYGEGGGPSAAHQAIQETVVAAYNSLPGIKADPEVWLSETSRRPDVVAFRGERVAAFTEVQQSYQNASVLWERDETHSEYLRSLGPDDQGFYPSTLWLASRAYEGSRGKFPTVYTSENGDRVTRGVYAEYDKPGWTGPDLDKPLEFDIDKFLSVKLDHKLYLVGTKGDDDCVWMYRPTPGAPPPKRGKRLRAREPELDPLRLCRRAPVESTDLTVVSPPAATPLPTPIVRPFRGVEPFTAPSNQPRRNNSGRYEVGDIIRNRITKERGEIVEVFGQRNAIYRVSSGGRIFPVAQQHAEYLGRRI